MKKRGFTLVELLAVIAILAILVIMALPAVLKMFNQARKDSFTNEVNTILRTARQQYLLSGGADTEWSNVSGSSNSLDLTGNSRLQYYVKMNNEGQITKLQVSNGDFQYNKSGIIDIAESSDVEEVTGENAITLGGNSIVFVTRANSSSITVGDEISIDGEHFYVISTNSSETALFAKYNLLVGNSIISGTKCDDYHVECWDEYQITSLSSSSGYGLQSADASGYTNGGSPAVGVVPFSATSYWVDSGLKSEYANSANVAGKTSSYTTPYPYVYDSSKSSAALVLNENNNYDTFNLNEMETLNMK